MFCSKCGTQAAEGAAFCANCGSALNMGTVAETPVTAEAPAVEAPVEVAAPVVEAPVAEPQTPVNENVYAPTYQAPTYQEPTYQQAPTYQQTPTFNAAPVSNVDAGSLLIKGILAIAHCEFGSPGIIFGSIAKKLAAQFMAENGGQIFGKAKVGSILGRVGFGVGIAFTAFWAFYFIIIV